MNKERNQPQDNWNETLSRALRSLPERPAPEALLPRVMEQVRARENARVSDTPYRLFWQRWPAWLRVTASALLAVLAAWIYSFVIRFYETDVSSALDRGSAICQTVLCSFAQTLGGTWLGIDLCRIILPAAGLLMLGMYITCIGVGTVLYRAVRR